MHARLSYKRAGHGNYSVSTLVDAGRRLTSLDFIVFTTLFRDVMQRMIALWALLIQSSGIEPRALQHRRAKQDKLEKCFMANLHYFREFLRILVLLRQHVGSKDLNSFVRACFFANPRNIFMVKDGLVPRGVIDGRDELCASSMNGKDAVWGKIFPTFMSALGNFLHEQRPSFSGIDLLVPPRWDPVKFMCLGPHCQCAFLAPRRQSANPQYVFASGPRRNGQLGRLVKLPAWVANSPRVAAQAESRYSPAPIRFHVRDRSSPPPVWCKPSQQVPRPHPGDSGWQRFLLSSFSFVTINF
jgi:hypothetical protein